MLIKREERGLCDRSVRQEGSRELLVRCMRSVVVLFYVIASVMFSKLGVHGRGEQCGTDMIKGCAVGSFYEGVFLDVWGMVVWRVTRWFSLYARRSCETYCLAFSLGKGRNTCPKSCLTDTRSCFTCEAASISTENFPQLRLGFCLN